MDEEFPVSQNPASGGSSQAKSQATKAAKKAARKATIAKGVATKKADKGVVHREDKFLSHTERNKRKPCGTMQRHVPSAYPGVAVLLFAAAHGALEDAAKAAGHGALEDAAKAAGHGALEDAAEVEVPRARRREEKRIAKATANQTAKDMEDAKAQEKADANQAAKDMEDDKAREKAAAKAHQEQEFLKVHYIGERAPCKHGCGAEVWPGEANLCCRGGKYILNADCNPPLDDAYLDLITRPRYSQQSRALNGGLAMASQGIYPSKALGGVGWHEQAYGHLALFGKTYLTMRDLGSNAFGHLALFLCVRAPVYVAISTMAQLTQ
jgi:hypothetical protein